MLVRIISFTEKGYELSVKIKRIIGNEFACGENIDIDADTFAKIKNEDGMDTGAWTEKAFADAKLIIFVSALGICVRSIAPFLKDKFTDPAVLCLDDNGRFVIPVASGHIGGANEWANKIARGLSKESDFVSTPVITTATDVNHKFSVDTFAKANNLIISDREMAKEISAAVLRGEKIGFICKEEIDCDATEIPSELVLNQKMPYNIEVIRNCDYMWRKQLDLYENYNKTCLYLIRKHVFVGIGCRKNLPFKEVKKNFDEAFRTGFVTDSPWDVFGIASIDLKKDEPCLNELADSMGVPFITYRAEELNSIDIKVSSTSSFVKKVTGVDNVCERSAYLAAVRNSNGQLKMIREKTTYDGMTISVVRATNKIVFPKE